MSDITNFPNGISTEGFRFRAGTVVTTAPFSTGTVDTGLGTVLYAIGNLMVAGTGASHVTTGSVVPNSGTVIFNVYGTVSAPATVAGTIHYIAVGS